MNKPILWVLLLVTSCTLVGCTPKVVVRRSGGINDTGIKYYRPKPYLLITPDGSSVKVQETQSRSTTTTTKSDQFVSIELQYLPDFSEEYSINVRPGLGNADVSLTLEDGWKLTELNQKIDSQFDESLTAVAELVKAAGTVIPTAPPVGGPEGYRAESITRKWVVQATNVPLGYYEAVLDGDCGQKKLYGWRYVGFAPFNSCPTQFHGEQCADCENDPHGPIYGLVFEKGVMTFRQLNVLQSDGATSNEMTGVNYGAATYRLDTAPDRIQARIREVLEGQSARGRNVSIKSIEQVDSPFPNTMKFILVTDPPLNDGLKNEVLREAGAVPGAPPKVEVQFNDQ